jgi:hypothetical protein
MRPSLAILFFLISLTVFSQDKHDQSWYVGVGKPMFPNNFNTSNNTLSMSVGFKRELSESFSLEANYTFSKSYDFPDFYANDEELDQYLISGGVWNFDQWADLQNHYLGAGIHYSFVNNDKWYFGIKLNSGLLVSKAKTFYLTQFSYDPVTLEIESYAYKIYDEPLTAIYFEPGFQTHYSVYKDYFIGLDLGLYQEVTQKHRLNDAYNLNGQIIIGKKF